MTRPINLSNNLSANEFTENQIASDSGRSYPLTPPQGNQAVFNTGLSRAQIESFIAQTEAKRQQTVTALSQYGINRLPWIFTTFDTISRLGTNLLNLDANRDGYNTEADPLFWVANPKSVSWQISQRASEEKNKSGTVLHVWRDRTRGTDYDDPKITIQFQSGSIHPIVTQLGQEIAPGLNNFYQFLELVDKSKISQNGEPNVIHILYRSTIFPSMVITGMFDPQMVVQFTDDAENPYKVSGWSATFTIYDTIPKLKSFDELRAAFERERLVLDGNFQAGGQSRILPATSFTGDFSNNA